MHKLLILSFLILGCSAQVEHVEIDNPASDHGKYPRLYTDNAGVVYMSWYEEFGTTTKLYYSSFVNNTWSHPKLISESDSWFVNWADFPSIIGRNGKPLAAHWLQKTPGGTYSYDVAIADAQSDFNEVVNPHNDGTQTEHGFVSMAPISDSSYYAIWLDGRNTMGGHGHDDNHSSSISNAMTLRGSLITTGKEVIDQPIDPNICDCCNTSLVRTSNGLLAAYRNRTEDEIRDIYVSSYLFESNEWSSPISVYADSWQIAACPVNGPMMDAINDDVAIAWFTGANNQPIVKLAFSSDAGSTFTNPIIIDNEVPLGRVDVLLSNSEKAWISWMTRTDGSADLKLAEVSKSKGVLATHILSDIDPSRLTGFPQLSETPDGLMVAWTDISGDIPKIKTMIIQ